MSPETPLRKPFMDPVVSEPVDALDATRAFGGMLGQPIFTSSGTALDDGDYGAGSSYPNPTCQDGVDGSSYCGSGSF